MRAGDIFFLILWGLGKAFLWSCYILSAPLWIPIYAIIIAAEYEWEDVWPTKETRDEP